MRRVAFDFGIIQIYWYSICILLGIVVGMFFVLKEGKKKNINTDSLTDIIFYTIVWGIIGARLYYVLFNFKEYEDNFLEIFEIWNGGLAIHGGIIFGLLYLIYAFRNRKLKVLKGLDICVPGLIIGQAIGRWGNFFNGEVYGKVVKESFFNAYPKFIKDGMYIDGAYRTPLFLYESIWNLIGFIILIVFRKRRYLKEGQITGLYLVWYGIGRFVLEGQRDSKFNLMLGSMQISSIISILLIVIGLFLLLFRLRTAKFDYLYNDENIIGK